MVEKRPNPDVTQNGENKKPRPNGAAPDPQKIIAEAKARAEAAKARLMAGKGSIASSTSTPTPVQSSMAAKLEEIKARVAAATKGTKPAQPTNISQLHPILFGTQSATSIAGITSASIQASKGVSGKPSARAKDVVSGELEEEKKNPYLDDSGSAQAPSRKSRPLKFHQKGVFIAQASNRRRFQAMDDMKRRIAESAKTATRDDDNTCFLVSAPETDVEWWDAGIIDSYEHLFDPLKLKIGTDDSPITIYIQHPVQLNPAQDILEFKQKPLPLTAKEAKKVRRQRRMNDLKDQQFRVRLGLLPPDPPKLTKSNMFRVLGEEAVKNPTAVEAMVNKQVADRLERHETANEERKLTKEQRHEKLQMQQKKDADKGLVVSVYRIENLSNPQHRYKVDINAKQHNMTGITILHPSFCLVITECGEYSNKQYKRLMLNRIRWEEQMAPHEVRQGNREALASFLETTDEEGNLKDLSLNKCTLVFEGTEQNRSFRNWKSKVCETDREAKETLKRAGMENMWTLAKSQGSLSST
ncbi:PRP3-domain-containing protein [Patellaria atrata CBS 101060]|uniref:PRP3-domain-containing protein n=1 Tax=Patellaria atrata CBS 101060 TaxID=1346257 RepID=A0A9P4S401_9PEZI|nr:PRP3-domain-containing protein [Patellaria atrata CBS 101060]